MIMMMKTSAYVAKMTDMVRYFANNNIMHASIIKLPIFCLVGMPFDFEANRLNTLLMHDQYIIGTRNVCRMYSRKHTELADAIMINRYHIASFPLLSIVCIALTSCCIMFMILAGLLLALIIKDQVIIRELFLTLALFLLSKI